MPCSYVCFLPFLAFVIPLHADVDVNDLIRRAVAATQADWQTAPRYQYQERDVKGKKVATYEVTMIEGSPYYRVIARNDRPLPPEEERQEKAKFQAEVRKRRQESPAQRAKRVAAYQRERDEDHLFLKEMAEAFTYRLLGDGLIDGHSVFVVEAAPSSAYQPPNEKAKVLTHMQGRLWIDKTEYQWRKVEAKVTAPVSLYLIAHVGPGTRFVLEQMPVARNLWLPKRFAMRTKVTVFGVPHERSEEETYSNYRPIQTEITNSPRRAMEAEPESTSSCTAAKFKTEGPPQRRPFQAFPVLSVQRPARDATRSVMPLH
jgi:hypothetical protein